MIHITEGFLKIFAKQFENQENKILCYSGNTSVNAPVIEEPPKKMFFLTVLKLKYPRLFYLAGSSTSKYVLTKTLLLRVVFGF